MAACALCGSTSHKLYVAQEAGVEVATGKAVEVGMVVCWQHEARQESGAHVRLVELTQEPFQTYRMKRARLK